MSFIRKKNQSALKKQKWKRIVLFEKNSYGKKISFKYFIGYRNETDHFPGPLCIKSPKMNGYVKHFDNDQKFINHLVCDEELLKNTMKYGKKIKIYLKESLIVTHHIIINTLILKKNLQKQNIYNFSL